jgi:hypothetical protein
MCLYLNLFKPKKSFIGHVLKDNGNFWKIIAKIKSAKMLAMLKTRLVKTSFKIAVMFDLVIVNEIVKVLNN